MMLLVWYSASHNKGPWEVLSHIELLSTLSVIILAMELKIISLKGSNAGEWYATPSVSIGRTNASALMFKISLITASISILGPDKVSPDGLL
jgi:hypothetical protein